VGQNITKVGDSNKTNVIKEKEYKQSNKTKEVKTMK
jgi:hypothetical protein